MSLNNFLCKYFKDNNTQCVTTTSLLSCLSFYTYMLLAGILLFGLSVFTLLQIVTGQYGKSTDFTIFIIESMGSITIVFVLFIILVCIWEYLSNTKLAECLLEKKEKES